jgi:hypothetical protein
MTTTMNMNSLEKLIQMATIEQMYSMLQKMKSNTETMVDTPVHSDRIRNLEKSFNELRNTFDELDKEQGELIDRLISKVDKLTQRIEQMEKKFEWERSNPPMSNPPMSNPPMSNPPMSNPVEPETCDNIVLTVEEHNETTMEMPVVPDLSIIETKESADDNQWFMPDDNKELTEADYLALLEHATASVVEEVKVKNEVEAECGEMESDTLPDKEVQATDEEDSNEVTEEVADEEVTNEVVEEYSEPEVETEDEDEPQVNEVVEKEVVEEEDEVEEGEVEEEEAEEEVFEIEIDEVTYYATSEDNGILYEMLEGGDIGKQVGTIQDGEPIFN